MTKKELVMKIANELNVTQTIIKSVIEKVFEGIEEALCSGQKIELRNFGILKVKSRKARVGRNPRTGQIVPIGIRKVITFKSGKRLRKKVENA
ncbi:MAG: HU family DNA-binding protein [bacterium]